MPRAALSENQLERFRDSLCAVATRRFAEHGYEGVTMRALAADLGCSPMTPYRYFQNKAEIFDAVRCAAFERFADSQEAAAATSSGCEARLRALCRAYARFALDEPHAYRIMFELDPPQQAPPAASEELRAWRAMRGAVGDAVDSGFLSGDADVLAHLFWSSVHGLVALHLAGKLVLGRGLEELLEAFIERELTASGNPHTHPNRLPSHEE
jgi:AcrR family transcriptional regulator